MKKFKVVIPEKRVEVVKVVYEIKAENIEKVQELIDDFDFLDDAEYVETLDSDYGFDVEDVYYDDAEITEVEDDNKI